MPGRSKLVAWTATIALGAVPIAAGCGGDDENETTAETSAPSTTAGGGAAGSTISVSETEFALDPADPTVKAGQVTIEATNDGAVAHSIEVEGPNGESELENTIAPGESGTLKVDLSKPGTYEWYCPVDDHKGKGMKGEITVQ